MIAHLLSFMPWEAWALLAIAAVLFVWVRFGNTPAIALGAILAAFVAYLAGRKAEREGGKVQEQQHAETIQNRADDARASAERIPDGKLREPSPFQRD